MQCIRCLGNRGGLVSGKGEAQLDVISDEASWRAIYKKLRTEDLLQQILLRENMVKAWKRVKANKGVPALMD